MFLRNNIILITLGDEFLIRLQNVLFLIIILLYQSVILNQSLSRLKIDLDSE